jgi:hypothetical protein
MHIQKYEIVRYPWAEGIRILRAMSSSAWIGCHAK